MLKLSAIYQQQVQQGHIKADLQQLHTLEKLQLVFERLLKRHRYQQQWWRQLLRRVTQATHLPIQGVYMWGSVGIGKTLLMDIFFNALPLKRKLRLHFHVFMQQVHRDLQNLQGHADPLQLVARHFALRAEVLCFDEFFVNDITDAMLLTKLLTALFNHGVTLITTSNQAPDNLYLNGLQRSSFLPTIALLKQHCDIIALSNMPDYRLRTLTQAGVYFYPLNEQTQQQLQQCFDLYAHGAADIAMPLVIATRPIATVKLAAKIVWFEFDVICNTPRSQLDYIAIAQDFDTVIINNVPHILPTEALKISYLINLVDVFYDQQVQLILAAAVAPAAIYTEGSKQQEFARTLSRLIEMQSQHYLARCQQLTQIRLHS